MKRGLLGLVLVVVACHRSSQRDATRQEAGAATAAAFVPSVEIAGLCHGGWCWENPLPTGDAIVDVAPDGPDRALFATGGEMLSSFISWDRARGFIARDTAHHVTALHRAGGTVWATTREGGMLMTDGTTLTVADTGVTTRLTSIWGASERDLWAVGDGGVILHFDGEQWSRATSPTSADLTVVRGDSAQNVWIVGKRVVLALRNKQWRVAKDVDAGPMAVEVPEQHGFCGTPRLSAQHHNESLTNLAALFVHGRHVMAAAGGGRMLRFDGKRWADGEVKRDSIFRATITALWGTSERDVWAAGDGALGHWDGARWSFQEREQRDKRYHSLRGTSSDDLWVVGDAGVILHRESGRMVSLTQRTRARLRSMHVGTGGVWAAAEYSVFHREAGGWVAQDIPREKGIGVIAIGGANDSDLWSFRDHAPPVRGGAGKAWTIAEGPELVVDRIRASAPNDVWAIGESEVARWDGSSWTRPDTELELKDVWTAGPGETFAVARRRASVPSDLKWVGFNGLVRWNGTAWAQVSELSEAAGWGSRLGGAGADLWLSSAAGVHHWSGIELTSIRTEDRLSRTNHYPRSVLARAKTDLWVASNGHASHWDGQTWTEEDTPVTNGSFAAGPQGVFAYNVEGDIARRRTEP